MTAFKTLTDEISDQFLACKICLETYKKPKTLSCLHTFCTSCLEAHLESEQERKQYRYVIYSRSITCPICRARTEVPSGGVRNLPDNFLVSNLTEVVNRSKPSSKTPVCDICSSYKKRSRNAVSKCLECSKFLCRNCVDLHKKTKVTKGHNIFDVEVEKSIMCKCHEEEPVRFFCQPCETCICVVCTFQEHVGHEVSSFGDGILKYVGNVQSMLKVGKTKMSAVQHHLDVMTKCENTIALVEERVNKLSETFLQAIRNQQKQVIDEIRQFYGSEALEILDNKDELEQIMSNLKSTCGLAELILTNRNVELLLLQREIKEKMKSLVNVDLPDLPDSMKKNIKFVEGSLSLGFLDTGDKAMSIPSNSLYTIGQIRPQVAQNDSHASLESRDACTMTVRMTKDRGICTDPYMHMPPRRQFENDYSYNKGPDKEGTSSDSDDSESTFKRILERRESKHNIFLDNEKFFNERDEDEEDRTFDTDDKSSSTLIEMDDSGSREDAVSVKEEDANGDSSSDMVDIEGSDDSEGEREKALTTTGDGESGVLKDGDSDGESEKAVNIDDTEVRSDVLVNGPENGDNDFPMIVVDDDGNKSDDMLDVDGPKDDSVDSEGERARMPDANGDGKSDEVNNGETNEESERAVNIDDVEVRSNVLVKDPGVIEFLERAFDDGNSSIDMLEIGGVKEDNVDKESKGTLDNDERIVCEVIQMEESCPCEPNKTYCDASTVTDDIEILQHYSELVLETDDGQTLRALKQQKLPLDRETMAEFNVQRLSIGNLSTEMFTRAASQDAPWQIIHEMHQLPVQTAEKGINVPDIMECDSSLEIEFIDVMLRDSATSTENLATTDQQTMTDCEVERKGRLENANVVETKALNTLTKSKSSELFSQLTDTLSITADTRQGLLELADGFYDIKDLAEFTLLEMENPITPDGTILLSKTVPMSDCGTETDPEVRVEKSEVSCGPELYMTNQATEAVADVVESATSPDPVTGCDFGTQTPGTETSECETMTEIAEVKDSGMLTDTLSMVDSSCETEPRSLNTVGTGTTTLTLVDQSVGPTLITRDSCCGDSIATVSDEGVSAVVEMIDSSCSPEIVDYVDTCLQTDGWDFKDAYVDTDSINVCDMFTDMPELQLFDVFTNTLTPVSVDESTSTDIAKLEDRGSGTDRVTMEVVGTLTDLLLMNDIAVGTMPLETSDAACEMYPENATKETMTPIICTQNASSSARFRRKKPARESASTSTDSVELVDAYTATFVETTSIGLGISPETRDDGTETIQPSFTDIGVEAFPILIDTGTHPPVLNTRDFGTDPVRPRTASVGINTYIISLAPRKRDASTTTARTVEEISQELESVVLKGATGGAPESDEPKLPEIDPDLLGQKISELFSLSKLQSLTEKLAQDRQKMAELRSRKHVLPTARMLEKRLSVEDVQPMIIRRRLSGQKSIDQPDELEKQEMQMPQHKDVKDETRVEEIELSPKKRPIINALLTLSKVSEIDAPTLSLIDITPAESSLDVTPGVSPAMTPSGDNLSSFSDAIEPVREKKKKHKKEKKKSKEKDRVEEERRRKSSSLKSVKHDTGAMASTPEDDVPVKKYKLLQKPFLKLGKLSKSMPTLARLDEKIDRFFRRSASRETTPSTSVANTPRSSRAGSPEKVSHHHQRKARPAKIAALLEQTILEKVKASTSEGSPTEDDVDIERESNV